MHAVLKLATVGALALGALVGVKAGACDAPVQLSTATSMLSVMSSLMAKVNTWEGKFQQKNDVYLGRFDIPVEWTGKASSTAWTKVSAKTGVGFSFNDYPGVTHVRQCVTFTDTSGAGGGLKIRLRRTDHTKAKTVFFMDDVGHSWSGSGLIHHECGAWHLVAGISCGYGWGATCQIDISHAQGVATTVFGVDFEMKKYASMEGGASTQAYELKVTALEKKVQALEAVINNKPKAIPDLYLGRFDIPTDFAGKASSTSWTKISAKTGVGFSFGDYKGATHVRQCVTFTDSSGAGGGLKLRLRRTDHTKAKTVFFTDDVGHSWSGSGLIHHECGTWHSISGISCGYGWGATCQIDIQHAQGVATTIYGVDFEMKALSPV